MALRFAMRLEVCRRPGPPLNRGEAAEVKAGDVYEEEEE
jgi:hypothetical protein